MGKVEEVLAFRAATEPFVTEWTVDQVDVQGVLRWLNGRPELTLFVIIDDSSITGPDDPDLPIFRSTAMPEQATITGIVPPFGFVTLERCARFNVRSSHINRTGRVHYELDFRPTRIWIGAEKAAIDERVVGLSARDTRISGFFGSADLKDYRSGREDTQVAFEALGHPERIWATYASNAEGVELGNTGCRLHVSTNIMEMHSATEGQSLRSITNLNIRTAEATTIEQLGKIGFKLEQMLSVLSLEPFSFEVESYYTEEYQEVSLAWQLDDDRTLFRPPMRHQILIDLSRRDVLEQACAAWFKVSDVVELSRWLFVRALKETDSGLARFVSVAQAFEVLGREYGPSGKMPTDRLARATELIAGVLATDFEPAFVARAVGLVRSSNRASFRDVLRHMLAGPADAIKEGSSDKLDEFCKLISDTRNDIVHMTDNDKGRLNAAFSRVNKLSLRLCFWYALVQAYIMQIPVSDVSRFAFNNRNAKHGLPNDALENS